MDFSPSQEHRELRNEVKRFVDREIVPKARDIDATDTYPAALIDEMAELGLLGMPYDPSVGGAGMDEHAYADALVEISRGSGAVGTIVAAHTSLAAAMIDRFGTDAQQKEFLVPLNRGEEMGAFALSEAEAGSDIRSIETVATPVEDGYRLHGEKLWTSNGSIADTIVTFARVPTPGDQESISSFILRPEEDDGVDVLRTEDKLGDRGCPTAALSFQDVTVPERRLLGGEGDGFRQALVTLNAGRISIAARSVGIARAAYEDALAYANDREQFDRPISEFQAIRHKLADMATKLRASELLMHDAADRKRRGESYVTAAAMAKLRASEVSREVSNEALQIHGGNGYVKDYDVERYYRDAKLNEIYEGTSEILRNTIADRLID